VFFGKKGRSQMTTSSEALSEKQMGVEVSGLDSTTPRVRKVSWFLQGPDTSRFPRGCMLSQGFTKRKQEKQKKTKNIFVEMATWAEKALYPGGKHGFRGLLEFSS
jgi:hypothetical protein